MSVTRVDPAHSNRCVGQVSAYGHVQQTCHREGWGFLSLFLFLEPSHRVKKPRLASWRRVAQVIAKPRPHTRCDLGHPRQPAPRQQPEVTQDETSRSPAKMPTYRTVPNTRIILRCGVVHQAASEKLLPPMQQPALHQEGQES